MSEIPVFNLQTAVAQVATEVHERWTSLTERTAFVGGAEVEAFDSGAESAAYRAGTKGLEFGVLAEGCYFVCHLILQASRALLRLICLTTLQYEHFGQTAELNQVIYFLLRALCCAASKIPVGETDLLVEANVDRARASQQVAAIHVDSDAAAQAVIANAVGIIKSGLSRRQVSRF